MTTFRYEICFEQPAWMEPTFITTHGLRLAFASMILAPGCYRYSGTCDTTTGQVCADTSTRMVSLHHEICWVCTSKYFDISPGPTALLRTTRRSKRYSLAPRILWKQFRGRVAFLNWNFERSLCTFANMLRWSNFINLVESTSIIIFLNMYRHK